MDQQSFSFSRNESHPHFLQLNQADRQALIHLMSQLIATVCALPEIPHNEHTIKKDSN